MDTGQTVAHGRRSARWVPLTIIIAAAGVFLAACASVQEAAAPAAEAVEEAVPYEPATTGALGEPDPEMPGVCCEPE